MKNFILAIVILIIGILAFIEFRYAIIVHTPVVAKFDRLTGNVWIVNSGEWRKVQSEAKTNAPAEIPLPPPAAARQGPAK